MNLPLAIRKRRERAKLTQYQAGALCGMQPAAWARLEAGRYDPKFGTVVRAAGALDCTMTQLMRAAERLEDPR